MGGGFGKRRRRRSAKDIGGVGDVGGDGGGGGFGGLLTRYENGKLSENESDMENCVQFCETQFQKVKIRKIKLGAQIRVG